LHDRRDIRNESQKSEGREHQPEEVRGQASVEPRATVKA
jgi:hypothetical protein